MVLLTNFCFWFSVRLGSIIIGIFTLIQTAVWFIICLISFNNLEEVKDNLLALLKNVSPRSKFIKQMASDPGTYLALLTVFFGLTLISCTFLIYGSFKCKRKYLILFILLDFLYIVFILISHIFLMLNFKQENTSLGSLILYSNIGGFICMYLVYMWISVISFYQVLKELEKQPFLDGRNEHVFIPVLGGNMDH